jgi:hypothetical protein
MNDALAGRTHGIRCKTRKGGYSLIVDSHYQIPIFLLFTSVHFIILGSQPSILTVGRPARYLTAQGRTVSYNWHRCIKLSFHIWAGEHLFGYEVPINCVQTLVPGVLGLRAGLYLMSSGSKHGQPSHGLPSV